MECAAQGCKRLSADHNGNPAPTNVNRFWCAEHADQAAPGDLEPYVEAIRIDPYTGLPKMSAEAEAHYEALYRKLEEEGRAKDEQRKREREALDQVKDRYEQSVPPISVGGFTVGPGGKVIDDR
jgi:hypothetical protein